DRRGHCHPHSPPQGTGRGTGDACGPVRRRRAGGDATGGAPLVAPGNGDAGAVRRPARDQRARTRADAVAARKDPPQARHRVPPYACLASRGAPREPMSRAAVPTATLLDALPNKTVIGSLPATVTGLAYDSRKVQPGDLFVAVPGLKQDGRRFAGEAVARGATAVVLEGADVLSRSSTGRVIVGSSREALARLADAYFEHPSKALTVVGI